MRVLLVIWIISLCLFFPITGQAQPHVSAESAILIEKVTGRVLFEKQADEEKSIASITKVMTALIALEYGDLGKQVKASRRAVHTEGSSIYLEVGEKMSLEDLLYGLMLRSGNDAALAISEHIGGSVEGFVYIMNETAKRLGMNNTNFMNPHGLHEEGHYSTAYDMAILMRYALQNEDFQAISETTYHLAKTRSYGWKNKNKLLTHLYEHSTGGKTGYTRKSGRTLLTTAEQNDLNLIAVTLNGPDDWNDHINLFEWGFKNYYLEKILEEGKKSYPINQNKKTENRIGYISEDIYFPLTKEELKQLKQYSYILKEDYERDSIMGKTAFMLDYEPIVDVPIYSESRSEDTYSLNVLKNMLKISGL